MRSLQATELPSFFSTADVEMLPVCACGSANTKPVYAEFGLLIEVCRDCGIARTNPRLKQSAIQRFYEESAKGESGFPDKSGNVATLPFPWRDATVRYRGLSKRLRRIFPAEPVPQLLEVGFGAGDFISQLRSAGFGVHGFDISATAVERLRKKE